MTDRENDEETKKGLPSAGGADPAVAREAGSESDQDEPGEEPDEESDAGPGQGFDPEQRRFLWTITAVLILGMLASTGINVFYQERQRSRQAAIARAEDEFNVTRQGLQQAQQRDISAMVRALQRNDPGTQEAVDQAMSHLMSVYQAQQQAYVAMRHEQGLDEQLPDPTGQDFADAVRSQVRQLASQGRRPATTQSTTAPGTTEPGTAPPGPAGAPPAAGPEGTGRTPPTQPNAPAGP